MIKIAICDDDKNTLQELVNYIRLYEKENLTEFDIYDYLSGEDLLQNYRMDFDIIFLDIKMNKINGIETARIIRLKDPNIPIFFLTSIKKYALYGYELNVINYLIKPLSYNKFRRELSKALYQVQISKQFVVIKNDSGYFKIYFNSILYIESYNRSTLIHREQEKIISSHNMKQIEGILDSALFFRCHTSYIVNFKYVRDVIGNDIFLSNNIHIPLSRKKKKQFLEAWLEYLGETI